MVAQLINCPACGAADTSSVDALGIHTCVYCGARYQIRRGAAAVAGERSKPKPASFVLLGLVVLGLTGALSAWFLISDTPPPGEAMHGVIAPAPVSPVAPVEPPPAQAPPTPAVPPVAVVPQTPPPVVMEAPEESPASATFEEESRRLAGGSIWVYGYVTNTSSYPIGKVKVSAILLDEAGEEISTDFGYSEWEGIAPGERSPVSILISDPPKHDRIDFIAYADKPIYLPTAAEGLEVEAKDPRRDKWMGWKTTGKVHNRGESPARFVRIDILGFDKDDKLIDIHSTYADAEILPPGESARFDATLLGSDREFTRFEFYVRGDVAG